MKLKSLLLLAIAMVASTSLIKAQLSSDSKIVAQWKFDEGTGTNVSDTKGTSNGTMNNMTDAAWVDGISGKALDFSTGDATAYVEVADNAIIDFNATTSFTISVFVKVADISGTDMNFIWKGATGKNTADEKGHWYGMLFKDNQLRVAVDDDATKTQLAFADANLTMTMDGWNHLVGVRDLIAGNLYLYINGVKVAEMVDGTTGDITSTPLPLVIGNNNGHDRNFLGALDEITMYNSALSDAEIAEIYNHYTSTTGVSSLDLIEGLKLVRNPVVDQLVLTNASAFTRIEIYNLTGALVKTISNNNSEEITEDVSNLLKGKYFVRGYGNTTIVTKTFLKF